MILLIGTLIWQVVAEASARLFSVLVSTAGPTYIQCVAGACVPFRSHGYFENTLPLLWAWLHGSRALSFVCRPVPEVISLSVISRAEAACLLQRTR